MNRRIFRTILLVATLGGTTWLLANTPVVKNWRKKEPAPVQASKSDKPDPAQVALLGELMTWLKPFDSVNVNCYYDALLTAIDKTDSAHAMREVPFRYARKGSSYYFRVDQTENLFTEDGYLLADHNAKKIITTGRRNVVRSGMPDLLQLFKHIAAEGYTMKKVRQGATITISMLAPDNINFKEFSVSYDSVNNVMRKIFLRQSDMSDHLDPDMDKLITLDIKQLSTVTVPDSLLRKQKFVFKKQDRWQVASAFSDYELVAR